MENQFNDIVNLIRQAHSSAFKAVNVELINLYWNVGIYIRQRIADTSWGSKAVGELALFIQNNHPELKGFSRPGLYRMVQFHECYAGTNFVSAKPAKAVDRSNIEIVSPVVRQFEPQDIRHTILAEISWTNHLIIISGCRTIAEKEFYIRMSISERYSKRELERQISSGLFERTMLGKVSSQNLPSDIKESISKAFRDSYVFEFLNLPELHNEGELQKSLIRQMKDFVLEIGKDFLFIGEEYRLQVGASDFFVDLLFFHRGLQCLVAFELKADRFRPEHLGQLNFYLEALDRDVKRPNENPSIGVLLCRGRDQQVVEYSLSRSLSPTMVAEYKTQLPDKKLLQQKLQEILGGDDVDGA